MTTLILTPTELEATYLRNHISGNDSVLEVCGFGPVGAAVGTCQLVQKHSPDHVILVGIAGSISSDAQVGNAYAFSEVTIHGLGVVENGRLIPPEKLGFEELPTGRQSGFFKLQTSGNVETLPQILTVFKSLDSIEAAQQRGKECPRACAEDMEGYAVAMACFAQKVPLTIIRGISNIAGDRDKANWQIDNGISSAAKAANIVLKTMSR